MTKMATMGTLKDRQSEQTTCDYGKEEEEEEIHDPSNHTHTHTETSANDLQQ